MAGVIGPFLNAVCKTVSVNVIRYRQMITAFFLQDDTTPHFAKETIKLLKEKCNNRTISRNSYINWDPRSCDSTLLD